jgi:hypothetical protein
VPFSIDYLCDVAKRALDKGRLEEADALYHAVAMLDEDRHDGWLGIAECAQRRGKNTEAVRILVAAAERFAEQPSPAAGYILLGRALELDPTRLDLHLPIAQLQARDGDVHGQQLASAYIHAGAWRQAQEVLAFAAGWDPQPLVAGEIELIIEVESDSIPIGLDDLEVIPAKPAHLRSPKEKTMVAQTVLRFPEPRPRARARGRAPAGGQLCPTLHRRCLGNRRASSTRRSTRPRARERDVAARKR